MLVCATYSLISGNDLARSEQVATVTPDKSLPIEASSSTGPEQKGLLHPAAKIVQAWLKSPILQQSQVGVELMDLPSGQIIYSFNGNRRFTPASTAKVFTTACALETLGVDFRYRTALQGYGPVKNGKLSGDLVIVPSQDPTFDSRDYYQLLGCLSEKKIKYIDGQVKLASTPGGFNQFNTGWLVEDWGQDWMPASSNLVLDHNIAPGKDPGRGLPSSDESAHAQSAMLRALLHCDMAPGWVIFEPQAKCVKVFRGTFPSMSQAGSLVVGNPDEYNLAVATAILRSMGVRMKSSALPDRLSDQPDLLGEHVSKPITDIIRDCLKDSDNLYAQQLLRTIGLKTRSTKTADYVSLEDSGLAHMRQWLGQIGVHQNDVVLVDGCGLSRKDCVTPHALNMVLRQMAGKDGSGPYIGLLRTESSGHGSYHYKTGAMDSVRTISGVVRTAGGNLMAATVMVNGHLPQIGGAKQYIYSLTSQLEALPAYHASVNLPESQPYERHAAPTLAAPAATQQISGHHRRRRHH